MSPKELGADESNIAVVKVAGSNRPRVLMLTQVLPYPLDSGPKTRAYQSLTWLSKHADVTLVSFVRDDDPPEAIEHLRSVCSDLQLVPIRRSMLRNLFYLGLALASGGSFIILRDESRAMRRMLSELVAPGHFSAVHADQLWMASFAADLPVPWKVLDDHNAVFLVFERLAENTSSMLRRWLFRREARKIARYECEQLDAFDRIAFVTGEDQAALATQATPSQLEALSAKSTVIPICVDALGTDPVESVAKPFRITFLGTMYWPPNAEGATWFAEEVLPRLRESHPDAVFTIVGKRPPKGILDLAARFGDSVEVTGYVADLRPLLAETAAFVVPLLSGGGMRVKILDAWAWGLPVVSTAIGAEGIEYHEGMDILVADRADAFADSVVSLLDSSSERLRLGAGGRAAVEARYDRRVGERLLSELYPRLQPGRASNPEPSRPQVDTPCQ